MIPSLVSALGAAAANPTETWIASSALELISSVLLGVGKGGLGAGFVAGVAPALFDCLNATQDREIIVVSDISLQNRYAYLNSGVQIGTQCLTLMVRKGCDQLLAWKDRSGRDGLHTVLSFIARLLSPTENESSGLLVGDLIVHLLRNSGPSILPLLPEMLQAMIIRLTTAKTGTFIQVFSSLFDRGMARH